LKGEKIMPNGAEERIAAAWRWPPGPGPKTDPIGMDYILEDLDPRFRTKLVAVRMEAVSAVYRNIAEVYRSIADGAAKAAEIVNAGAK
jgi:hypothetical protein